MVELFANSGDPDQMPHSAVSDLGLHYLPITILEISRLQWVKVMSSQWIYIVLSIFMVQDILLRTEVK